MTNYRIYIYDNGVVSESLIQANSRAEATEFYVQSIIDGDISINPPCTLSKDTEIRIDQQKPQDIPGKVIFGHTSSLSLSDVDSWNKNQ